MLTCACCMSLRLSSSADVNFTDTLEAGPAKPWHGCVPAACCAGDRCFWVLHSLCCCAGIAEHELLCADGAQVRPHARPACGIAYCSFPIVASSRLSWEKATATTSKSCSWNL